MTTQYVFQVIDQANAQSIPGFTAKNASELCTGKLVKTNTDGTAQQATASDKPTGFWEDHKTLEYRPTDIYSAAGVYGNIVAGHVQADVSSEFFIGNTLPAAGADLYSAAGGLMDTTGTNAIGKVLLASETMRWYPNTTKSLVRIDCHFGGKDI